jgi:hypothetical protein
MTTKKEVYEKYRRLISEGRLRIPVAETDAVERLMRGPDIPESKRESLNFEPGQVLQLDPPGSSPAPPVVVVAVDDALLHARELGGDCNVFPVRVEFCNRHGALLSTAPRAGDTWSSGESVARIEEAYSASRNHLLIISEGEPFAGDVVAVARKLWEGGYRWVGHAHGTPVKRRVPAYVTLEDLQARVPSDLLPGITPMEELTERVVVPRELAPRLSFDEVKAKDPHVESILDSLASSSLYPEMVRNVEKEIEKLVLGVRVADDTRRRYEALSPALPCAGQVWQNDEQTIKIRKRSDVNLHTVVLASTRPPHLEEVAAGPVDFFVEYLRGNGYRKLSVSDAADALLAYAERELKKCAEDPYYMGHDPPARLRPIAGTARAVKRDCAAVDFWDRSKPLQPPKPKHFAQYARERAAGFAECVSLIALAFRVSVVDSERALRTVTESHPVSSIDVFAAVAASEPWAMQALQKQLVAQEREPSERAKSDGQPSVKEMAKIELGRWVKRGIVNADVLHAMPVPKATNLDAAPAPTLRVGMVVRAAADGYPHRFGRIESIGESTVVIHWANRSEPSGYDMRDMRHCLRSGRWTIVEPDVRPLAALADAVAAIFAAPDRATSRRYVDIAVQQLRGEPFAAAIQAALVACADTRSLSPIEIAGTIAALRHWEKHRPFERDLESLSRRNGDRVQGGPWNRLQCDACEVYVAFVGAGRPHWYPDDAFFAYERARSTT